MRLNFIQLESNCYSLGFIPVGYNVIIVAKFIVVIGNPIVLLKQKQ